MKFVIERCAVWRADASAPKPDVSFVPALARRRLTSVERAALHVAHAASGAERITPTPVVFASRWGEIGATLKLMDQFRTEGEMSPAGFSSSVHNAAPGAWSLFTRDTAAYTAIAARSRSLEAGLLEAFVQLADAARGASAAAPARLLFVFAEEDTPEFYRPEFPAPETAKALALLLSAPGDAAAVDFRSAAHPPLSFEEVVRFGSGECPALTAAWFQVERR